MAAAVWEESKSVGPPSGAAASGDIAHSRPKPALDAETDPGDLLRGQAGKQVLLHVLPEGKDAARDVIAKPVTTKTDGNLRYSEWEWTRHETVEKLSHGSIGYVHLRAMGSERH